MRGVFVASRGRRGRAGGCCTVFSPVLLLLLCIFLSLAEVEYWFMLKYCFCSGIGVCGLLEPAARMRERCLPAFQLSCLPACLPACMFCHVDLFCWLSLTRDDLARALAGRPPGHELGGEPAQTAPDRADGGQGGPRLRRSSQRPPAVRAGMKTMPLPLSGFAVGLLYHTVQVPLSLFSCY